MIAYVDASVLLRVVLREPNPLAEWNDLSTTVASRLLAVECMRTIDRLRQRGLIQSALYPQYRRVITRALHSVQTVPLTPEILAAAADPLPSPLGTLDAIHLVTALRYRKVYAVELVMATHDQALAAAARSYDFPVIGC